MSASSCASRRGVCARTCKQLSSSMTRAGVRMRCSREHGAVACRLRGSCARAGAACCGAGCGARAHAVRRAVRPHNTRVARAARATGARRARLIEGCSMCGV
jgi:hypothetical protein